MVGIGGRRSAAHPEELAPCEIPNREAMRACPTPIDFLLLTTLQSCSNAPVCDSHMVGRRNVITNVISIKKIIRQKQFCSPTLKPVVERERLLRYFCSGQCYWLQCQVVQSPTSLVSSSFVSSHEMFRCLQLSFLYRAASVASQLNQILPSRRKRLSS